MVREPVDAVRSSLSPDEIALRQSATWYQFLSRAQLSALRRASDTELDGGDLDLIPDGRDRVRASLVADWRRNWLLGGGILATTEAELAFDAAMVNQDPDYGTTNLRALPSIGVELRWPPT